LEAIKVLHEREIESGTGERVLHCVRGLESRSLWVLGDNMMTILHGLLVLLVLLPLMVGGLVRIWLTADR
jgi:hypothetical protein